LIFIREQKGENHRMTTQLLCTFAQKDDLDTILENIQNTYSLVYNYIYVLQNKSNLDEIYVTYNIDTEYKPQLPLPNTILVHRKKETNTLYTINALNEMVKEENNGVLDRSFMIDWTNYKNSIIVTSTEGTRKLSTRIFQIIELETVV